MDRTPLHIAAHMDNRPFVYLLLKNGNSPAYVKQRRFICSSHCGQGRQLCCNVHTHDSMSRYVPVVGQQGSEYVHASAESGRLEEFELLKARLEFDEWSIKYEARPEFGSLINKQDEEGNTHMYLAAINGHYKIVDKLKHCTSIHYSI